jgi:hypothetical protein
MAAQHQGREMLPPITYRDGVPGYLLGSFFVPRIAGGETPPNPGEGDPPPGDGGTGKDGKPFDAERAQRTIDQLRDEVRAGKATQKELDEARKKLKEIEDAGKSELERATARATEEEQRRTAAEQRAADLALQLTVERAAGKLGFHDPDDAFRLIDRRAVKLSEDGEPENVEELLKALAKAKPHLVKAEGEAKGGGTAAKGTPPNPKPGNGKAPTRDDLIAEKKKKLEESGSYARLG